MRAQMDLDQWLDRVPCGDSINDNGSELSWGCGMFVAVAVRLLLCPEFPGGCFKVNNELSFCDYAFAYFIFFLFDSKTFGSSH